jgi:hypothetical protein
VAALATVTEAGTERAVTLLFNEMSVPPAAAGLFNVILQGVLELGVRLVVLH